MRNFSKIILAFIPLVFPNICQAQLCGPNTIQSQNPPRPTLRAVDFIKLSENLEFKSSQQHYAELYVKPKFLNVRSNPRHGEIVGTAFRGQKLRVYAKYDEWVAISRRYKNLKEQYWVHSGYLSSTKTNRIDVYDLLSRCDLHEMVRLLDGIERTNGCKSVHKYLLWEGSSAYSQKLEQHLRSSDRVGAYGKLNFCPYPFFW